MDPMLMRAIGVVTLALVLYSIAVVLEQKKNRLSQKILFVFTGGIILDITSTTLMILGSQKIPLTIHGILGYTALSAMLLDGILLWRFWRTNGDTLVPHRLNRYTRYAYGWWVTAYIAGAIISLIIPL